MTITRKEFFIKSAAACTTALCCCMGRAQEPAVQQTACDPEELKQVKGRTDAARDRFSALIEKLESSLPEAQRKQLLHELGSHCADTYRSTLLDRYRGNIHGFLEEGRRQWMAEASYDETNGVIDVVDKGPGCSCPMVKEGVTPASFCDCTLGWQEAAYSTILGRPVRAELKESILRGDKRCAYRITVL
jgi:predicted hydrocarbon binding protein